MFDDRGSYYYPNPADVRCRVYVRGGADGAGGVEFRLWHADHPQVWERHEWLTQEALEKAAALYREMGRGSNPMALYDVAVARALLKEEARRKERT